MESGVSIRSTILADVGGLVVLSVIVVPVLRWLASDTTFMGGLVVCGTLAVIAVSMWHSKLLASRVVGPTGWAKFACASVVVGGLSFLCDALVAGSFRAATSLGSPLGFGLTMLICPGVTVIAVAGSARAIVLMQR